MLLNTFLVHHAFQSEAGPLWICRQVFDGQTQEQIRNNPPLLFWRNDMLRKPRLYGSYVACWAGSGIKCHGIFLVLFLTEMTPYLGAYRVGTHLHSFDLELDKSTTKAFEPHKAYEAQARTKQNDRFTPNRFIETYGDVTIEMENLPEG